MRRQSSIIFRKYMDLASLSPSLGSLDGRRGVVLQLFHTLIPFVYDSIITHLYMLTHPLPIVLLIVLLIVLFIFLFIFLLFYLSFDSCFSERINTRDYLLVNFS